MKNIACWGLWNLDNTAPREQDGFVLFTDIFSEPCLCLNKYFSMNKTFPEKHRRMFLQQKGGVPPLLPTCTLIIGDHHRAEEKGQLLHPIGWSVSCALGNRACGYRA